MAPLKDVAAQTQKRKFKAYPIGYFHVDITEGKLQLFVAIDRTSKFAVARLMERANARIVAEFLHDWIATVPYRIHTVLTDNGIQCPKTGGVPRRAGAVILLTEPVGGIGIKHRLTKPNHLWTNGQVERMNRTIKEATVRTYHYDQLQKHLSAFLNAYNFSKRLKTLHA